VQSANLADNPLILADFYICLADKCAVLADISTWLTDFYRLADNCASLANISTSLTNTSGCLANNRFSAEFLYQFG